MPTTHLFRLPEPPLLAPVRPLRTASLPVYVPAGGLAVLPDGDTCVVACGDLCLVSLATGEVTVVDRRDEDHFPGRLALAGDGLVTAGEGGIRRWDTARWVVTAELPGASSNVLALAAGGGVVVAGGWDGVQAWDVSTGALILDRAGPGLVTGVAVTPDGRRAVTVGWDRGVVLWSLRDGAEERTLRPADPAVTPLEDWDDEIHPTTVLINQAASDALVADGELTAIELDSGRARPWGPEIDFAAVRWMARRPSDGLLAVAANVSPGGTVLQAAPCSCWTPAAPGRAS